ncbi:cell division ATP-binding protein FtsE [Gulosibacter macacae]|uniref:Cell division ATP-binding protein FtsE n=1 Tax=Gulosibacter macacae TaxID=2488791 RepID=A0A3P3W4R9_9MICO|nr:cell division ATP-binding protein FtsE [Gulosibacter macacae]RRJ88649.1 cell division ATP-binding protein FtsE [Gulosibacter macacae]
MIRFDHVSKLFRGQTDPALDDVTFEILRGEFAFLVGASGSGKSTVLRHILLEEHPTEGQVHVLGQDLQKISLRKVPFYRRNVGMVFQDFRLLANKTVFENVAYAQKVIGKTRGQIRQAVPEVLKTVGLQGKEDRFPHELSGGEQQRVAIARAVVNKPAILLADEPTGNLDPATSREIMKVLRRINRNGTAVVMATHDVSIVDEAKQRVIELDNGAIVRDEEIGVYTPEIVKYEEPEAPDVAAEQPHRQTIAEAMAERVGKPDRRGASAAVVDSPTTRLPEHDDDVSDWADDEEGSR